ncbi:MAG: hypothetical protein LBJ47_06645, partial [Tannerella sp.]|nr:hypothetical protein [Tannerella sp.]
RGSYNSIRGRIATSWKKENGTFILRVEIPANTTATVILPADRPESVTVNARPLKSSAPVPPPSDSGELAVELGSGTYELVMPAID